MEYLKKFIEFVTEARYDLKIEKRNSEKSEFRHTHKISGWSVIPSIHAASQAMIRRPEYDKDDWRKLHSKVIDHIISNSVQTGTHIFYSGKVRQGYVANVDTHSRVVKVITVLDVGTSRTTGNDTHKHVIESCESIIYID